MIVCKSNEILEISISVSIYKIIINNKGENNNELSDINVINPR